MKKNKLILILLLLISIFIGINSVYADDDETTPCNRRNENTCHSDSNSSSYSCIWVDANEKLYKNRGVTKSYCNTNDLIYIACGDAVDIPRQAPKVFSSVYTVFQLGVPIVLIITSIITLIGAITANSEDVMNKAKGKLFKKMIAAILVFLVMTISKFIISLVPVEEGGADMDNLTACLDCFLNDDCKANSYYKTYIDNEWHCTTLNSGNTTLCKNMFSNSTYAEAEKVANTDG